MPRRNTSRAVRVRMYRHGLGDCFLLSFAGRTRSQRFHVLIDCGLISVAKNPKEVMTRVVQDIQLATGRRLDLVVVTHQHWDHVSGFSTEQAQQLFADIEIRRVWYAWTEDPRNKLGQRLREEREAKVRALHQAVLGLRGAQLQGVEMCPGLVERLDAQLAFFGFEAASQTPLAKPGESTSKVQQAFDFPGTRPGVDVQYRYPGDGPLEFPELPGVRSYVLGPPEDEGMLKRSDPTAKGREVYEFALEVPFAEHLTASFSRLAADQETGLKPGADLPFDEYLRLQSGQSRALKKLLARTWDAPGQEWRKIEGDWATAAESLALSLDKHTNNTSLALAFEFADSGRVLLFPGDAQVGNWLSWHNLGWRVRQGEQEQVIRAADLLSRTVFYKVGHHGSHNATLRAQGLELMTHPDLVACVPVSISQARKNRWFEMPFEKLLQRLRQKTRGRVFLSDPDSSPPSDTDLSGLTPAEKRAFRLALKADPRGLYYDFTVQAK